MALVCLPTLSAEILEQATWFVMHNGTDPSLVSKLYADGHEIATHTW